MNTLQQTSQFGAPLDGPLAYDSMLNIRSVCERVSLAKSTVFRLVSANAFPKPIRLTPSGRRVAWRQADVATWLQDPTGWKER